MAKWTGWWEQRGLGRRTMHNLVLDVAANGVVKGSGDDCIGPFTFEGQFRHNGTVSLIKQYIGRHWVSYEGQNSGEGIFGTWCIEGFWTGRFALRPLADSEDACDEIQASVPAGRPPHSSPPSLQAPLPLKHRHRGVSWACSPHSRQPHWRSVA